MPLTASKAQGFLCCVGLGCLSPHAAHACCHVHLSHVHHDDWHACRVTATSMMLARVSGQQLTLRVQTPLPYGTACIAIEATDF